MAGEKKGRSQEEGKKEVAEGLNCKINDKKKARSGNTSTRGREGRRADLIFTCRGRRLEGKTTKQRAVEEKTRGEKMSEGEAE